MLAAMGLLIDSFWRAALYLWRPRVIALSMLPLVLTIGLALGLGWFWWDPAVAWVRGLLDSTDWVAPLWNWLDGMGLARLKAALAPLIVIFTVTPLLALVSLLIVALMMTPAMVELVAQRRFPQLERRHGGSLLVSVLWSLGSTLAALLALLISSPLWLVPPLILILPPLIWGWLTYRVMAFDALAVHASREERQALFREHRGKLLVMGVICGYLGAAPSLVWASGALFAAAFLILVPVALWLYTLVFAFSSLWFSHYALSALAQLRQAEASAAAAQNAGQADALALAHEHQADRPLDSPPAAPAER